uniref:G_PROTEIN_RECEP_F1_2 domain-containing protein n=1 Tax=Globodera pallida TaxID=36090 RepID=A0A183CDV3_GLOPA
MLVLVFGALRYLPGASSADLPLPPHPMPSSREQASAGAVQFAPEPELFSWPRSRSCSIGSGVVQLAPASELFSWPRNRSCSIGSGVVQLAPAPELKEHRANVMLVVIIVKFLISDILPTVLDVFETFIGNEVFMASPLATLWVDFSNFLLVINCSTNFWVFLLYVRGFRQRCVHLIANSFRCTPQSPRQHDEVTN